MKYNYQEVFDRYKEVDHLNEAIIFHLYDTGEECFETNSGYHDSRHFILWAFNTKTMEKCNLGRHDGINAIDNIPIDIIRVYSDGSFFISLKEHVELDFNQCILISKIDS